MTDSRDILMHRSKAALKYRAMIFCPAAPEGQPKARRGENPGNVWACAATNLCTEAGRGEVSGNEILFCRAGATTESKARYYVIIKYVQKFRNKNVQMVSS